jgi:hypothetical protein
MQPYIIQISPYISTSFIPRSLIHPVLIPSKPSLKGAPDSRQQRFAEFRVFGPLVQVDTHVDLGLPETGDLLHFWVREDAEEAIKHVSTVLKGWTRIVNLTRLKIIVSRVDT